MREAKRNTDGEEEEEISELSSFVGNILEDLFELGELTADAHFAPFGDRLKREDARDRTFEPLLDLVDEAENRVNRN